MPRHDVQLARLAQQLSEYANLDRETEARLVKLAQDGDTEAQQVIVESLALLSFDIAMKFNRDPDRVLDSFQEGILGIYKAFIKYDFSVGASFCTYATHCMKTMMCNLYNREQTYRKHITFYSGMESFDPFADTPAVGARLELDEQRRAWVAYVKKLQRRINDLTPRAAEVMLAYMRGETTTQAAERAGCTRQRIQQILAKSRIKIADSIEAYPPEQMPSQWNYACCG